MATQQKPATSVGQGFYDALGRPLFERAKNEAINRGVQYGYQNYIKPAWESATAASTAEVAAPTVASETAGSEVASQAAASGATNMSGGALAAEGLAGVGWGGAASLLAPVVMAYLQYQKGSGVNEPVRKQYETRGMGKMLSDMSAGKNIDPATTRETYGIKPKYLDDWNDPSGYRDEGGNVAHGFRTVDPRGYRPEELYEGMHHYGAGHKQTNGIGNSGYSDQQIDEMFGNQKGGVAKLLGGDLPDFSNTTWDQSGWDAPVKAARQKEITDQLGAMTESDRGDVLNRNRQGMPEGGALDDKFYLESLARERERAEIEKMLGYRLGQPTQV